MQQWRATRPADVARLNGGVFLAVARAYLVVFAVLLPGDAIASLLLAHHRLPTLGITHVLALALPFFVTGFLSHVTLGLLGMMFLVAVNSLIWWRHVLAVGGPSGVLAALALSIRRVVFRLAHRVDPVAVARVTHREQMARAVPAHPLLDQLRAALLIAPDAPPSLLAHLSDHPVRTDQLTSRRAA